MSNFVIQNLPQTHNAKKAAPGYPEVLQMYPESHPEAIKVLPEIVAKSSIENDDLDLWKAFLIERYTNQVSEARTSTQQLHDIAKLVRAPKILYVPELEGGVSDITNLRKLAEAMTPID